MTLEEAKRILPAPVTYGRYKDEDGRLSKPYPLFTIPGRGKITEREYLRLAMVVAVNAKRGK